MYIYVYIYIYRTINIKYCTAEFPHNTVGELDLYVYIPPSLHTNGLSFILFQCPMTGCQLSSWRFGLLRCLRGQIAHQWAGAWKGNGVDGN